MFTSESITAEPIRHSLTTFRAEHETGMAALPRNEAVASLHQAVAQLIVDPELLKTAVYELGACDAQWAFVDQASNEQLQGSIKFPFRSMSALQALIMEADHVFREVIRAEISPEEPLLTTVTAGAYESRSADAWWHRDFGWQVCDRQAVTYAMELIGEPTTVSIDSYRDQDFLDNRLRAAHTPWPSQQWQYDLGAIVAIDGTLGVYRTPGEEYAGRPWLSFRSFIIGTLAPPQDT